MGRGSIATFDDLDRSFDPGTVTMTVQLSDAKGNLVAAATREVELTRSYPNGKDCDNDGYVHGGFRLSPDDRVQVSTSPAPTS